MNVGVIGLGLIGGSFAKTAAQAGHKVRVWNRTRATADRAVAEGVAQAVLDDDIGACDIIIVALPPAAVVPWIDAHQATFGKGAIVVDATGVKGAICAALEKYAFQDRWTFVGGHPMAGKETSGWDNASADLFRNASMILTPYPSCGRGPLDMLEKFFTGLGFGRAGARPSHAFAAIPCFQGQERQAVRPAARSARKASASAEAIAAR